MTITVCCLGRSAQELYARDICEALDWEYAGRVNEAVEAPGGALVFPLGSTPSEKAAMLEEIRGAKREAATLVHPSAVVARATALGAGILVGAHVSIAPKAVINDGAVVHTHCVLGHDNRVGYCANLSPGCLLAGGVTIGPRATLGMGVVVVPNKTVGEGANVWAGAVVQKDVEPGKTLYNLPPKQPFEKAAE